MSQSLFKGFNKELFVNVYFTKVDKLIKKYIWEKSPFLERPKIPTKFNKLTGPLYCAKVSHPGRKSAHILILLKLPENQKY